MVPITSVVPSRFHDPTCEIHPGQHQFIAHDSYIEYRLITQRHHQNIETCADSLIFVPKPDVIDALFQAIIGGIDASPFTPRWAKKYFRDWPNT